MTRREFAMAAAALGLPVLAESSPLPPGGSLADVAGLKVGHFTSPLRPTGCTVVLAEEGATAGVDVRGSAPGTRETDLLNPVNSVERVHAVVLSGGSAFGLDAASGVVRYLAERRIGFATSAAVVPIVPAAILYDLGLGDPSVVPDAAAGYQAAATAGTSVAEGSVGAGSGATVGKLRGMDRAMKGGLGTASIRVGELVVAALAAVNAMGDVIDPATGKVVAGARNDAGDEPADARRLVVQSRWTRGVPLRSAENTTLAVVATNAAFTKSAMTKIAQMAHDGLARTIYPAHMPWDGDTVFALSTGRLPEADLGQVGALAAEVLSRAVLRAVLLAESLPDLPAARDLRRGG
jgi:L-aminopeptidase/D-esterase-like protein